MLFPDQRVQVDVKFVPAVCLVGDAKDKKFYQYTAIDEYSRYRYVEAFEEHSSYSSAVFLEHMRLKHKVRINIANKNSKKQEVLQSEHGSIPKRLLTFLFGEFL